MLPLAEIFLLCLMPAAAMLLGGGLAFFWRPGAQTRSAIQHFTAGVVIAAVAAELVPALHVGTAPLPMALGFLAGIGAMLAVRRFAVEEHDRDAAVPGSAPRQTTPLSQAPAHCCAAHWLSPSSWISP